MERTASRADLILAQTLALCAHLGNEPGARRRLKIGLAARSPPTLQVLSENTDEICLENFGADFEEKASSKDPLRSGQNTARRWVCLASVDAARHMRWRFLLDFGRFPRVCMSRTDAEHVARFTRSVSACVLSLPLFALGTPKAPKVRRASTGQDCARFWTF